MSNSQREIKGDVLIKKCKYHDYLFFLGFELTTNETSLFLYEKRINEKVTLKIRIVESLWGISRIIKGNEAMIADAYRIKTKEQLKFLLFGSDTISFLFKQRKEHIKTAL